MSRHKSRFRGILKVRLCACGAPVLGGAELAGGKDIWCAGCVQFVEELIGASSPQTAKLPSSGVDLFSLLATIEKNLIDQALARSRNTAQAARLLGLNRTTLAEKLRRLRLAETEATP